MAFSLQCFRIPFEERLAGPHRGKELDLRERARSQHLIRCRTDTTTGTEV